MAEAATARKTEQDKTAVDLKAAQDNLTAAQTTVTELKAAAEKTPSEDEFLAKAPESIRTLVAEKKAQDAKQKSDLVEQLKTAASGVYTEDELNAMSIDQLTKTAQLAKIETPDYSGRALPLAPRTASDASTYTPPDPWAASIAARSK